VTVTGTTGSLTLTAYAMASTASLSSSRPVVLTAGTIGGTLSGAGGFTVTGSVVASASFQNTAVTATALTVQAAATASFTTGGSLSGTLTGAGAVTLGAVTVSGGTTFGALPVTSTAGTTFDTTSAAITVADYSVTGSTTVTVTGANALTLTTANLAAGTTVVTASPLVVNGGTVSGALQRTAGSGITLSGVSVTGTASFTHAVSSTFTLGQSTSLAAITITNPALTDFGTCAFWLEFLFCFSADCVFSVFRWSAFIVVTGQVTLGVSTYNSLTLAANALVTYSASVAAHTISSLQLTAPCGLARAAPYSLVLTAGAVNLGLNTNALTLDGLTLSTPNNLTTVVAPGTPRVLFSNNGSLTVAGSSPITCPTCPSSGADGSGVTLQFQKSGVSVGSLLTHSGALSFDFDTFTTTAPAVQLDVCFYAPDVAATVAANVVYTPPAVCVIPPYNGCAACAASPNTASCVNLANPNRFICTCAVGFTGTLCQTNVNECSSNPCRNGGSCVDGMYVSSCGLGCLICFSFVLCWLLFFTASFHSAGYTCTCVAGYSGLECQTNVNEVSPLRCSLSLCAALRLTCAGPYAQCGSSPCLNGGSCFDGLYVCCYVPVWWLMRLFSFELLCVSLTATATPAPVRRVTPATTVSRT
jgi:hypothetical protein